MTNPDFVPAHGIKHATVAVAPAADGTMLVVLTLTLNDQEIQMAVLPEHARTIADSLSEAALMLTATMSTMSA